MTTCNASGSVILGVAVAPEGPNREGAIISMTKVLALEWAGKGKIPASRFAYPEGIAACVLFLAGNAAPTINA